MPHPVVAGGEPPASSGYTCIAGGVREEEDRDYGSKAAPPARGGSRGLAGVGTRWSVDDDEIVRRGVYRRGQVGEVETGVFSHF
jgi:hypothetical protein